MGYGWHSPVVRAQQPIGSDTLFRGRAAPVPSEVLPFVHFGDQKPEWDVQPQWEVFPAGVC